MSARSRAEEYLEDLERAYICIKQREDQLEVLRAKAEGGASFRYDRDRIQNSSGKNIQEERMIEYAAKSEEVSRRIAYYEQRKDKIITQIQEMRDPRHIDVLYKRYVQFKSRYTTAEEMGYQERQIDRITTAALRAFYYQHLNVSQDVAFS